MRKILIILSSLLLHTLIISPMSLKDWNAKHTQLTTILGKHQLENFPTAQEWTSYWPVFLCDSACDDSENMHLESNDYKIGRTNYARRERINNLYKLAKHNLQNPKTAIYACNEKRRKAKKPSAPLIKLYGFCRYTYELDSEKSCGDTIYRTCKNSHLCTPLPSPEEILTTHLNNHSESPTSVLDHCIVDIN